MDYKETIYTEMIYLCIDVMFLSILAVVLWRALGETDYEWAWECAPWSWQKALLLALAVVSAMIALVIKYR